MTLLPLQHPVSFFGQAITVFDVVAIRIDGREQTTTEPARNIFGVIQPATDKIVSLDGDGAISAGDMLLHTWDTVYTYDYSQIEETNRQTRVIYMGEQWKLYKTQTWSDKVAGKTNRYIMKKYTNIDSRSVL